MAHTIECPKEGVYKHHSPAEQWAEIDKAIQLAALDGRNECTLELTLLPKTKENLTALGYKFNEESSPRNEFHTTITW